MQNRTYNQQNLSTHDLEAISNINKDGLYNLAIVMAIQEPDPTPEKKQERVANLEALLHIDLERETGEDGEKTYYEKVEEWDKEVKDAPKELKSQKRREVENKKFKELMKRVWGRVPMKVKAPMWGPKEIPHVRKYLQEKMGYVTNGEEDDV